LPLGSKGTGRSYCFPREPKGELCAAVKACGVDVYTNDAGVDERTDSLNVVFCDEFLKLCNGS
jgi:hypothetical protein